MIELYAWSTPNGRKVSVMLEEVGLPYRVIPVDIREGEQHAPEFVRISPNAKIPALVDPDGPDGAPIALFESGAILIYLAEKTGRLLPEAPRARYETLQWLMWQMGGFGPLLGQAHHFLHWKPDASAYASERYAARAQRLYRVLDRRLGDARYVGGDEYTIADIATYPWAMRSSWQGVDLAGFPNVARWADELGAREAVKRGMDLRVR